MLKKVLIYGESWQGCHGQLLLDDLSKRGYEVNIFDHTKYLPGIINRNIFERMKRKLFIKFYSKKIQNLFLKKINIYKPSHVIICKGLNLNTQTLDKINKEGIFLTNWNPDDFLNMKNSNRELIKSIPKYNLIISSRPHLFEEYKSLGAKGLLFIDWYFVPTLHKKRDLPIIYDLTFVGSWSKKREEFIYKIPYPVTIWGGGWEKSKSKFKKNNKLMNTILSQKDMSSVFEQSKFNINLLTDENRDLSNLRFFEVPASGGLLVTERNKIAEKYLEDGKDCIMFNSVDDLIERLKKEDGLNIMCSNGREKINNTKNSFSDRVNEIVHFLNHNK